MQVTELAYRSVAYEALPAWDPEVARAVVLRVFDQALRTHAPPTLGPDWDRHRLEVTLQLALCEALGPWALGFTWSASEPGGGGLVKAYCCGAHSLFPKGEKGVQTSTERVLSALVDWRQVLAEMSERFVQLANELEALELERQVERAALQLLPWVLERTAAEDAWYRTLAALLTWWLESIGHERAQVRAPIERTLSGHFQSWVAPKPETSREAAATAGLEVACAVEAARSAPDALEQWAKQRSKAFAGGAFTWRIPLAWDGHRRLIEGAETARDALRAGRMKRALTACRAAAKKGGPLTLVKLASWQALVLGAAAPLRTTTAFAKQGRECYGNADLEQLERWLEQANSQEPVLVRAARVYLDVCFFHPFDDGNARAARLALDYVLTREGYVLRAAGAVFALPRSADDPSVGGEFLRALSQCAAHQTSAGLRPPRG